MADKTEDLDDRIARRLAQMPPPRNPEDVDEEMHRVRAAIAAEFNYDANAIYEHLRQRQREGALAGQRYVAWRDGEIVDVTDQVARGEL